MEFPVERRSARWKFTRPDGDGRRGREAPDRHRGNRRAEPSGLVTPIAGRPGASERSPVRGRTGAAPSRPWEGAQALLTRGMGMRMTLSGEAKAMRTTPGPFAPTPGLARGESEGAGDIGIDRGRCFPGKQKTDGRVSQGNTDPPKAASKNVDVAQESTRFGSTDILEQAASAVLAHALKWSRVGDQAPPCVRRRSSPEVSHRRVGSGALDGRGTGRSKMSFPGKHGLSPRYSAARSGGRPSFPRMNGSRTPKRKKVSATGLCFRFCSR